VGTPPLHLRMAVLTAAVLLLLTAVSLRSHATAVSLRSHATAVSLRSHATAVVLLRQVPGRCRPARPPPRPCSGRPLLAAHCVLRI
jgi:hypothetical protein